MDAQSCLGIFRKLILSFASVTARENSMHLFRIKSMVIGLGIGHELKGKMITLVS